MAKITLFSQVIGKLPKEIIRKIIRTAGTDKHCKGIEPPTDFCTNNDGSTLPVIKRESINL